MFASLALKVTIFMFHFVSHVALETVDVLGAPQVLFHRSQEKLWESIY